jgi:ArsR family transcriptional regulator
MDKAMNVAMIAAALSDPLRVQILELLAEGRRDPCWSPNLPDYPTAMCALDLQRKLGDMSASKLAYHMKELRAAGLVQEHKQGKWVYYMLSQNGFRDFVQQIEDRFLE